MKDEHLYDFLAKIKVARSLTCPAHPGGGRAEQCERMVALVKRAFNKAAANGTLITWSKLQDVLPDVEVTLNNRPLSYVEEDTSYPYSRQTYCSLADQIYYLKHTEPSLRES